MALAHAILATLLDEPQSGYDLMKKFQGSVGNFWRATHQQIYRELNKLEDQQWVTATTIAQAGRPDKKLYRITELGQQHLAEWVGQPCQVTPVKEELLVKTFVGGLVAPSVLRQELERHRQIHQKTLDKYRAIAADNYGAPQLLSQAEKLRYAVLRRGIQSESEWVVWCDEVIELLGDRANDEPV